MQIVLNPWSYWTDELFVRWYTCPDCSGSVPWLDPEQYDVQTTYCPCCGIAVEWLRFIEGVMK